MRVPVGMGIGAAFGARFGIAARPDASIDRIPRPRAGERIRRHQPLEGGQVHGARSERVIEAAPAPLAARRQAQMRRCFDGWRAQQGVEEREEGVAAAAEGAVHLLAEGSQRFQFGSRHIRSMRARAFSCLFHGTDTPL